jgi:hypothetical protein
MKMQLNLDNLFQKILHLHLNKKHSGICGNPFCLMENKGLVISTSIKSSFSFKTIRKVLSSFFIKCLNVIELNYF